MKILDRVGLLHLGKDKVGLEFLAGRCIARIYTKVRWAMILLNSVFSSGRVDIYKTSLLYHAGTLFIDLLRILTIPRAEMHRYHPS